MKTSATSRQPLRAKLPAASFAEFATANARRKKHCRTQPGTESKSVAAKFEALDRKFFADFIQAGHAEVLALQQIVARAADQLADRGQAEPDHALAGTY